ncbi:unnamed protein product [Pieris brassicae]|uniref:Uncharacterized protein n=1 Tax=Pieris brassicae TaxID=7116 RepID=A0A9P0TSH8_PIEBR|nr:unnamed protein product [Pieris brassicae]
MSTGIFICLTVLVIQNVTAQFRVPELSPQTVPTLQNQNLQNLWSLGPLSSPTSRMKLVSQRHRYIIKKPQKKINKRQLMAELFKQSAIKNIQDAASICNRKKKSKVVTQSLQNWPNFSLRRPTYPSYQSSLVPILRNGLKQAIEDNIMLSNGSPFPSIRFNSSPFSNALQPGRGWSSFLRNDIPVISRMPFEYEPVMSGLYNVNQGVGRPGPLSHLQTLTLNNLLANIPCSRIGFIDEETHVAGFSLPSTYTVIKNPIVQTNSLGNLYKLSNYLSLQ